MANFTLLKSTLILLHRIFLLTFGQFIENNLGDITLQNIGQAEAVDQDIGQFLGDSGAGRRVCLSQRGSLGGG